jgi:GntR family transcriptional regulator of arabinose operon
MTSNSSLSLTASNQDSRQCAAERVAGVLSEQIRLGLYKAGDLLPTERMLAADLHVHRRSVRTAIEQLVRDGLVSHRPNCRPVVARSLPKKSSDRQAGDLKASSRISTSNLIALLMWHGGGPLEHAGTSQQRIFWGMNQSLTKAGYHAVFLDLEGVLRPEKEIAAQEAAHLRYIRDQGFGGALFYPYAYRHNRELVEEVNRSVPLVLLDRKIPDAAVDFVGSENYGAMFEVTKHLIAQGHRRIAYVTRPEPIRPVQDRIEGYIDAMRQENAPDVTEMILTVPHYWGEREWPVVDAVFRLPEGQRPTAAVCFTDYMAVSLAERLEYLGLSIPDDVALTGFDDIVPAFPNGVGLTTVAQPYEDIGIAAVDLLLQRIKAPLSPPKSIALPVRFIARASSIR